MYPDDDRGARRYTDAGTLDPRARLALLVGLAVFVAACAGLGFLGANDLSSSGLIGGSGDHGQAASSAAHRPTATLYPVAPASLLAQEIYAGATLRGTLEIVYLDPQFNGTVAHVVVNMPDATLDDAQWDAYQVFRAVWTGRAFHIPADWIVHVTLDINYSWGSLGTPISETPVGVANLSAASAAGFPWAQLTPEQAWGRYDSVLYDPNGVQ